MSRHVSVIISLLVRSQSFEFVHFMKMNMFLKWRCWPRNRLSGQGILLLPLATCFLSYLSGPRFEQIVWKIAWSFQEFPLVLAVYPHGCYLIQIMEVMVQWGINWTKNLYMIGPMKNQNNSNTRIKIWWIGFTRSYLKYVELILI